MFDECDKGTSIMKYFLLLFTVLFLCKATEAQELDAVLQKELSKLHKPTAVSQFDAAAHLSPLNQDTTNACWSFATLSFIESEMVRLGLEPVRLAMIYPVYCEFLEKARHFVETEGQSRFAGGDLFNGVMETIQNYGIIPLSAYKGNTRNCPTYNHDQLDNELDALMKNIKSIQLWDEQLVLASVQKILDKHLGAPPETFEYKGKSYTPKSFRDEVVRLPWDEYITVTSFMYAPFYQFTALDVPDNYANRINFFNVPLDLFYEALRDGLKNGYSAAFDADTDEPGRMGTEDVAFIPDFDIPSAFISQEAREFRVQNGSTTDVHLMHLTGYRQLENEDWFLVKDSWRSAWQGDSDGYYFFHGDYLKLKALAYLIHQDAVPEIAKHVTD